MEIIQSIIFFFIAIFILVFIHEWGHFAVARYFNVKVLQFSVGMGKEIYSFYDKLGTKFSLSMLPIGGYVSLLGEQEIEGVPDKDKHLSFIKKHPLKKIAILAAGPAVNLIFAIILFFIINLQGISTLKPVIGKVIPDTVASRNNFIPNSEVVSVNNEKVKTWEDVYFQIIERLGTGDKIDLTLKKVGEDGVFQRSFSMEGIVLNEEESIFDFLGFYPIDPTPSVVSSLKEDYPAATSGLLPDDEIIAVDGITIRNRTDLIDYVKKSSGMINFSVKRNEEVINIKITPKFEQVGEETIGIVGIVFKNIDIPEEYKFNKHYSIPESFFLACDKVAYYSSLTLKMIYRMIVGDVSVKHLTGPVSIANYAGQAANYGVFAFINFLAIISISLGVLNLLPIPVLDGGQIVFCSYELVVGKELSDNFRAVANFCGVLFIVLLTFTALYNDISKLI